MSLYTNYIEGFMVIYSFPFSLTQYNIRKLGFEKHYAIENKKNEARLWGDLALSSLRSV